MIQMMKDQNLKLTNNRDRRFQFREDIDVSAPWRRK